MAPRGLEGPTLAFLQLEQLEGALAPQGIGGADVEDVYTFAWFHYLTFSAVYRF